MKVDRVVQQRWVVKQQHLVQKYVLGKWQQKKNKKHELIGFTRAGTWETEEFVLFTFPSGWPLTKSLSKCQLCVVGCQGLLVRTFFQNLAEETTWPAGHRKTGSSKETFTDIVTHKCCVTKTTERCFMRVKGNRFLCVFTKLYLTTYWFATADRSLYPSVQLPKNTIKTEFSCATYPRSAPALTP